ncbi:hypothetical protein PoB_002866000 [Plakobranchus ocellatus]|uniref:Uncharacterized protein n=1 Tax=Plakobranchus ocellatus TaxID=259542 RepID=A0AAV4A1W6_9GAST|nr:hypothetical protein PoB_002866000 [Plakobranchus ocellatus]
MISSSSNQQRRRRSRNGGNRWESPRWGDGEGEPASTFAPAWMEVVVARFSNYSEILSRVRAPPSAPRPDGGPKSLRSPCCGLAICNNPIHSSRNNRTSRSADAGLEPATEGSLQISLFTIHCATDAPEEESSENLGIVTCLKDTHLFYDPFKLYFNMKIFMGMVVTIQTY